MVVNNQLSDLIDKFISITIEFNENTKFKSILSDDFDPKKSERLNKELEDVFKRIISLNGLSAFEKLLDNKNPVISQMAAIYLYPLDSKKCKKILINYMKKYADEIEKFEMKEFINGMDNELEIFKQRYIKLFGYDVFNQPKRD